MGHALCTHVVVLWCEFISSSHETHVLHCCSTRSACTVHACSRTMLRAHLFLSQDTCFYIAVAQGMHAPCTHVVLLWCKVSPFSESDLQWISSDGVAGSIEQQ